MKKIFSRLLGTTLGLALALGAMFAIGNNKTSKVEAAVSNVASASLSDDCTHTNSGIPTSGSSGWVVSVAPGGYESASYARGWSFANGADPVFTYYSSDVSYGKVTVTASTNANAGNVTLSVSVGGTAWTPASSNVAVGTANANSTYDFIGENSGNVVVTVSNSNGSKSSWIKNIEIFAISNDPSLAVNSSSLFFRTGGSGQTVTATPSNFSGIVSYSWAHQSGTDCVDLANSSSATVTMTPKNSIVEYATGVYRVTATYNSESATADVTVVVDNGTQANPYSVAQARAAIDGNRGKENAYVKGVVFNIEFYSDSGHYITYWISDNGSNSNPLQIYHGKGIGLADFSSQDDIKIGDIVVVNGNLTKYQSTYEFGDGNQLVSQISVASIAVKTEPSDVEYNEDEYFNPTGLVITATYNDTPDPTTKDFAYADLGEAFTFNPATNVALSNEDSVLISLFGKSVSQSITVTTRTVSSITVTGDMTNKTYVEGSDWDYRGLSLTIAYNIGDSSVVNLSSLTAGTDFTVSSEKANGATSLTISGSYNGDAITSRTITGITYVTSVAFDATQDAGVTDTLLFKCGIVITITGGKLNNNTDYRPYKNQSITIACPAAKIARIEFVCTSESYNGLEGDGYTRDGANGVWIGFSNSVTLSSNISQTRATSITIVISEVNPDEVDALQTNTMLSYRYTKEAEIFNYSDISIRFGGVISKTLWNNLDTNQHAISGFGVMIASGEALNEGEYIKNNLNAAVLSTTQPAPSIDNGDIVNYYMDKTEMATPVEQGDNYFWNLFQTVDTADIEKVFVAVAYIKVGGDYVFMSQVRYSVKTLAADYIANRGCNAETASGSLSNLAS